MLSSSEELSPIQSVISLVIDVALGLVFSPWVLLVLVEGLLVSEVLSFFSRGVVLVEGWFEVSEDLEDEGVASWLAEATGTKTCPEANLTGTAESVRARPDRREPPRPRRPETERPRGFMMVVVVVMVL